MKPNGNASKPNGNASKPNGNASKPIGNASKPIGNASKPNGNASKPNGNGITRWNSTFWDKSSSIKRNSGGPRPSGEPTILLRNFERSGSSLDR